MWLRSKLRHQALKQRFKSHYIHQGSLSILHVFLKVFHSAATSILSIRGLPTKLCCSILSCSFQRITERWESGMHPRPFMCMRGWVCVCVCVPEPASWRVCVCQDTASICRALEGNACLVSGGQQEGVCAALRAESSAISCSLARTALSQVQCTVKSVGEWGIRRLRSNRSLAIRHSLLFIYLFRYDWKVLSGSWRSHEVQMLNMSGCEMGVLTSSSMQLSAFILWITSMTYCLSRRISGLNFYHIEWWWGVWVTRR